MKPVAVGIDDETLRIVVEYRSVNGNRSDLQSADRGQRDSSQRGYDAFSFAKVLWAKNTRRSGAADASRKQHAHECVSKYPLFWSVAAGVLYSEAAAAKQDSCFLSYGDVLLQCFSSKNKYACKVFDLPRALTRVCRIKPSGKRPLLLAPAV
ncbi:hypothetical protein F2P81_018212 [Scophthalmus maximus]|uniref:Uncharacterized protein n=1 Tax=Scophthalmus maximus TaxID=52904 RepID=A0A6A4S7L1_SCOMX|nr:hypothetical protein F2P81_018212 [Scophthalmus maximus]